MVEADLLSAMSGVVRNSLAEVPESSHHFLVLRHLNRWIEQSAPLARGVVLDYGCGAQPYRDILLRYADTYLGADVAPAKGVSLDLLIKPGAPAPLPDGSVDTILSTQTLEHVYEYRSYLEDCNRLLRHSGSLFVSVPMHWRQHEVPFDYWRFTRYAMERMLSDAGFSVVSIAPCGGFYSVIGQAWLDHRNEYFGVSPWLARIVNRLALVLDQRYPDVNETLLWMCHARKG